MTVPVLVQGLAKPRAIVEQRAALEVLCVHPGVNSARVAVVVAQDHAKLPALLATRLCHLAERTERAANLQDKGVLTGERQVDISRCWHGEGVYPRN